MKKLISNSAADPCKIISFASGFKHSVIIKLSLLLIFFPFSGNILGQNAKNLERTLDSLIVSAHPGDLATAVHLRNLVYELQPTVFIQNDTFKIYGTDPAVKIDLDGISNNKLSEQNPLFSQAELILIRINNKEDLSITLDIESIHMLAHLKYVLFLCSFDCELSLFNSISQSNPYKSITILYQISIPN